MLHKTAVALDVQSESYNAYQDRMTCVYRKSDMVSCVIAIMSRQLRFKLYKSMIGGHTYSISHWPLMSTIQMQLLSAWESMW